MIQKTTRGVLFLFGLFVMGVISLVSGGLLKKNSSLIDLAYADGTCGSCGCPYTQSQCDSYAADPTAGCGCCGDAGCFPAGTLVNTPEGQKEIQNIRAGDNVYGFDTETGVITTSVVTDTMKHSWEETGLVSPLVVITHEKGTLTLTVNHPVYKKGSMSKEGHKDFENAGNLKVGDVLTTESEEESKITNITEGPQYDYVYNIEVDKVHTYTAEGVRVHNKSAADAAADAADAGDAGDDDGE